MTPEQKGIGSVSTTVRRWESALVGHHRTPADDVVRVSAWAPDDSASYCPRCGGGLDWSIQTCACSGRTLATRHGTLVRLSSYQEPVSEWIRMMKYQSWVSMAKVLGELLGKSILQCSAFEHEETPWLVPVPMPWSRRFVRGMDHAALLCKGVAKTTGFQVFQPLKQINGRIQSGATVSQRSRKRDPFRVSLNGRMLKKRLKHRRVIVIDDVRTTGRTIGLVARALEGCGAVVIGAGVLAVADMRESATKGVRSKLITGRDSPQRERNGENLPSNGIVSNSRRQLEMDVKPSGMNGRVAMGKKSGDRE